MKNFMYFFALCAYILSSVGGIIVSIVNGMWPMVAAILVLSLLALPKAIFYFEKLKNMED